jgi:predicted phosphate transport protein (TIGR00153 family)
VLKFRLIPREERFYDDFLAMAELVRQATGLLEEMLAGSLPDSAKAEAINDLEHRCDFLTHEIIQRLHRTFVTPIDREDIHALASSLDDVMDAIDHVADLFIGYRIAQISEPARRLAHVILLMSDQVLLGLRHMEQRESVTPSVVEVNRLENEADRIHKEAIITLFEQEKDPIAVIKWKEIYDCLEATTDRMEDVSDVVQGVIVKHA